MNKENNWKVKKKTNRNEENIIKNDNFSESILE